MDCGAKSPTQMQSWVGERVEHPKEAAWGVKSNPWSGNRCGVGEGLQSREGLIFRRGLAVVSGKKGFASFQLQAPWLRKHSSSSKARLALELDKAEWTSAYTHPDVQALNLLTLGKYFIR